MNKSLNSVHHCNRRDMVFELNQGDINNSSSLTHRQCEITIENSKDKKPYLKFGTNEIYNYIKTHISNIESDNYYELVNTVVEKDTNAILSQRGFFRQSKITLEDINDIIQDVQISVYKGLLSYVDNSACKNEQQRNAWFNKIVNSRINDYLRRYYRLKQYCFISLNDENNDIELADCNNFEEYLLKSIDIQNTIKLFSVLKSICDCNTAPEKILAYLYCKFICAFHHVNKCNGSPKKVAEELNGKTLGYIAEMIKNKVQSVISCKIPNVVFNGLDEKLNVITDGVKVSERIFDLSPLTITDSSYRISTKMKKCQSFMYENGDNGFGGEHICR